MASDTHMEELMERVISRQNAALKKDIVSEINATLSADINDLKGRMFMVEMENISLKDRLSKIEEKLAHVSISLMFLTIPLRLTPILQN